MSVGALYSSVFRGNSSRSNNSGSATSAGKAAIVGAGTSAYNTFQSQNSAHNAVKEYAQKVRNSTGTIPPRVSAPNIVKGAAKGAATGAVVQASYSVVKDAYNAYKQGGWGAAGKSLLSHMVFY